MEADWAVEIGPDLPVIEVAWDGLADLRSFPEQIAAIEEARRHPAIREALLALNASGSPVFSTKCDCWELACDEIDADEFAASCGTARVGYASYVDVAVRDSKRFASFEFHEQRARAITSDLRVLDLQQGRVDVMVRAAVLREESGFGITLYAAGCGANDAAAYAAWQTVLRAAVAATISSITGE